MKRSILLVLLILMCCLSLLTCDDKGTGPEQFSSTYNLLVDLSWSTAFTDICPTTRGCIAGGIRHDKSYIARIDNSGNILWDYYVPLSSAYCELVEGNQDKSILTIFRNYDGQTRFFISSLDQSGTAISESNFASSQWGQYYTISRTKDGSLLLIGECSYDSIPMAKADIYGNQIWKTALRNCDYRDAFMALDTRKMGLVLCGYRWSVVKEDLVVTLINLDEYGNIKWEKSLADIYEFMIGFPGNYQKNIAECSDGGLVLLGMTDSGYNHNLRLMKINKYGYVEWIKTYDGTQLCRISDIIDDNGDIVVTGYLDNPEITGQERIRPTFLMKVDRNGILKWIRDYPGVFRASFSYGTMDYLEMPFALCKATDGGYYISGALWNSHGGFIIKTDMNGNIADSVIEIEHLQ